MDNFRTNRLNFTKMVDKHMHGYPQTKYFNTIVVNPEEYYEWNRRRNKEKGSYDNINIQRKINSIVAHVHSQLKERKPTPMSKIKREAKKEISRVVTNREQAAQTQLTTSIPAKSANDKGNLFFENSNTTKEKRVNKGIGIPRLKVLCRHKEQKRIHHTIPPATDDNHFVNQKRMAEIRQQNAAFEYMINDQKQLKRDRQSIAQEIITMRDHLDDIRGRLDSSLQKLEQSKTYGERNSTGAAKKLKTNHISKSHSRGVKK